MTLPSWRPVPKDLAAEVTQFLERPVDPRPGKAWRPTLVKVLTPAVRKVWSDAWVDEERGPDGKWVSGGGGTKEVMDKVKGKIAEAKANQAAPGVTQGIANSRWAMRARGLNDAHKMIKQGANVQDLRKQAEAVRQSSRGRSEGLHAAADYLENHPSYDPTKPGIGVQMPVPKPGGGGVTHQPLYQDQFSPTNAMRPQGPGVKVMSQSRANEYVRGMRSAGGTKQTTASRLAANCPATTAALAAATEVDRYGGARVAEAAKVLGRTDRWITKSAGGSLNVLDHQLPVVPGIAAAERADSARAETMVREAACSTVVHTWANTSNDTNVLSLSVQEASAKEFDLPDQHIFDWPNIDNPTKGPNDDTYDTSKYTGPSLRQQTADNMDRNGATYQQLVRTMYNETQKDLQAEGVTHVPLLRGMSLRPEVRPPDWNSGITTQLQLRPLSSFASTKGQANKFTGYGSPVMVTGYVPITRILSTCQTGFGCQNEKEWVILAGSGTLTTDNLNKY
jgi:hypothetical protein